MQARLLLAALAATLTSATSWAQTAPPPPPPVVVDKPATTTPPVTPTARPPELVKLEAEAAVEIPSPQVPAGKAPEARQVAEAAVKVRRASWVVEKLLPPPPEGLTTLNLASLKVGNRGWLDTTGDVTKTAEGVMFVRPAGAVVDGLMLGLPVTDLRQRSKR